MLRPITLYPFPIDRISELSHQVESMLVVEMNAGQMVEDVRLSVNGKCPVSFLGRMGGMIPSPEDVAAHLQTILENQNITVGG